MSINIAVLASGRGSNLEAILEAIAEGKLDAKVQLVLVNVPGAGAIDIPGSEGEIAGDDGVVGAGRERGGTHHRRLVDR